jgi:hypothetical protein
MMQGCYLFGVIAFKGGEKGLLVSQIYSLSSKTGFKLFYYLGFYVTFIT